MAGSEGGRGIPRGVEVMLALGGLVVSSPFLFLAAILIRLTSPGPVLFRQQRVGRMGKRFELIKFRSMRMQNQGAQVTAKGDARITRIGRLLRKTKLDEMPELWNVARGELSLVGPRPEVARYVNLEDPMWQNVLEARPGITDPVTLALRNEEELLGEQADPEAFYVKTLQPYKLAGYVRYLEARTWKTDVRVLLGTLSAIVGSGKGVARSVEDYCLAQRRSSTICRSYPGETRAKRFHRAGGAGRGAEKVQGSDGRCPMSEDGGKGLTEFGGRRSEGRGQREGID